MRILFVDNLLFEGDAARPWFDLQPHLGLMSLAAVASAAGHEATIFDPKRALVEGSLSWNGGLYDEIARTIVDQAPEVVGFTALGCNFHCVVAVARAVRALRPSLPLLLGGPHATILHREILERLACFDAIARHEAEDYLEAMLAALGSDRMAAVPGVTWRDRHGRIVCNPGMPKVDALDALPVPAYAGYPLAELGLGSIRVEAGRGCPFSCTFCSTASFFGRAYRLKSSRRLVAEMDALNTRYGFADFKLNHDLFTVNRKKVLEFCAEVSPRGYRWACSARVDCVDDDLLAAMAQAGCTSIYFGIESGSEAMQVSSRKRLDLTLVEPVLATTERLGISTTTSFIIGYPEETHADQAATLDLAGRLHLRPLNRSQIHLLTPEPGTMLLEHHRDSLEMDRRRCGFNLPRFGADDDSLIDSDPELFVTHFHLPTLIARERNVLVAALWRQLAPMPAEAFRSLLERWDGSLSAFADDAHAWWLAAGSAGSEVPRDALARFAASVFGRGAPLVSLLRYTAACDPPPPERRSLPAQRAAEGRPRLSAGAAVLREIHDVARLGVSVLGLNDEARDHLVVLPAAADRPLRAYLVDESTADLLEVLAAPNGESILAFVEPRDIERLHALHLIEGDAGEGHAASAPA